MTNFKHVPVLLEPVMEYMINGPGLYVDCTTGGAGHSSELLRRNPEAYLLGLDKDMEAIEAAGERLKSEFDGRFRLVHTDFKNVKNAVMQAGLGKPRAILMDLGVSSHQFDTAQRGFSYNEDAPLDMRMDKTQAFSALDVVNGYSEKELERVIREYGEENWAKRIAQFIVERRPINTTFELVEAIKAAIPKGARRDGPHPARRTFMAIRIEVNGELLILEQAVKDAAELLDDGGRLLVITFHSLEDRIVKQTFQKLKNPCTCPPKFPVCVCGKKSLGEIITRKPIVADDEELDENSRARSAKLRVFERRYT